MAFRTACQLQLQLFGLPARDYVLQTSTNFTRWISLSTIFSPPDPGITVPTSLFNFSDFPTNFLRQFYRAIQLR